MLSRCQVEHQYKFKRDRQDEQHARFRIISTVKFTNAIWTENTTYQYKRIFVSVTLFYCQFVKRVNIVLHRSVKEKFNI